MQLFCFFEIDNYDDEDDDVFENEQNNKKGITNCLKIFTIINLFITTTMILILALKLENYVKINYFQIILPILIV